MYDCIDVVATYLVDWYHLISTIFINCLLTFDIDLCYDDTRKGWMTMSTVMLKDGTIIDDVTKILVGDFCYIYTSDGQMIEVKLSQISSIK